MTTYTKNLGARKIPSEGSTDAKIMIVGPFPSISDEKIGRPFTGETGRLLDQALHVAGILRQTCYITNVIKERPPNNNAKAFINLSLKGGPKVSAEYLSYLEDLKAEIDAVNPNVIVAVGAIPFYALTGIQGITKWRGSVIPSTLVPSKKVIPIIHPDAALRQYIWRHFIAIDFKRVRTQSYFPDLPADNRQYYLRPSFELSMEYLESCKKESMVAFDIEVSSRAVTCISFARTKEDAISIPFIAAGQEYFTIPQEVAIWKKISEILESREVEKVGQNVMFDSSFLCREYGIVSKSMQDTMVAQAILTPDFPKGLDFITSLYTLIPYYKDEGKSVIRNQMKNIQQQEGLNWEERFWMYNAKDSIVLMEAFPQQLNLLIQMGNYETYKQQVALIEPLLFMTERGIRMDTAGMAGVSAETITELDAMEAELKRLCGFDINPRSPKQLKEYFYETLKLRPYLHQGKPSTNEKALKRMSAKGVREATLLLEYRKKHKLRSTYYEMGLDEDKRLRSSINPVGARTGRLSSGKTIYGTGANIQNQPPAMKKFMRPDEGYLAFNVDLSQAENRIVAYLGPDIAMIEAFENGIDIHSNTAGLIFGIDPMEIKQMDDNDVKCDLAGQRYTHRFWGKKANHGLNYGLGYKSFALHLEVQEKEARFIWEQYHRAYPGVRKFHLMIQEQLKKNRTVENLFGRKYRFVDRWGDSLFKDAYAFIPQSTVADKINRHGLNYLYYNQETFPTLELLMQVHDSIVFQIPLSVGFEEQAGMLLALKASLEQPISYQGRSFSIPMDTSIHLHNLKAGIAIKAASFPSSLDAAASKLERAYKKLAA